MVTGLLIAALDVSRRVPARHVSLLLVCGAAVGVATGVAAGQSINRPNAILHDVETLGAKTTLNELYRDGKQWKAVLRGIASGTSEWFAVAEALWPASDAQLSEALIAAVGEALGSNARLILLHATGPVFVSEVCRAAELDDERFNTLAKALGELNRRIKGLRRVSDPGLAEVREDCLRSLRQSEAEVRQYFDSRREPLPAGSRPTLQPGSLGAIIGSFKSAVTKGVNEQVVTDLEAAREYIRNNPVLTSRLRRGRA